MSLGTSHLILDLQRDPAWLKLGRDRSYDRSNQAAEPQAAWFSKTLR